MQSAEDIAEDIAFNEFLAAEQTEQLAPVYVQSDIARNIEMARDIARNNEMALVHIHRAFDSHERSVSADAEAPVYHAMLIQNAFKVFLQKKSNNIDKIMPDRLKCPITKELMRTPVLASDETTYELDALLLWFDRNSALRFPCRGPMGRPMNSTVMTLNRAVVDEIAEFCFLNKMSAPSPQAVPHRASNVSQANSSSAPVYTPVTSAVRVMVLWPPMTLNTLFSTDGFLDEICKPGL